MNLVQNHPQAYLPGTHCIVDIHTVTGSLTDPFGLKQLWDGLIVELGLQKIGEVYHQFENGGFTAVVCLTESHLSIHTWPEFGYATFDIFLSNYLQVNDGKGEIITQRTADFLKASQINQQKIRR